jgi:hypothetical protein
MCRTRNDKELNMAKEFDWLTHEILGDIDEIALPIYAKPLPLIPVMDEDPALRKGRDGSSDALVADIELASMVDLLAPAPDVSADVARFSPEPKAAPGLTFVKTVLDAQPFVEEVLPTSKVLEEWTPNTQAMVAALIKSAYPSRKKIINDRLDKRFYRPELMNRWNEMLVAFEADGSDKLPDDVLVTKARHFLEVAQ